MSATQLRLRALPDLSAAAPPPDTDFPLALVEYIAPDEHPDVDAAPAESVAAILGIDALSLMPDAGAAAAQGATPTGTATSVAAPIDPALDRHFSALRAQPIVLYAQQLEPIGEGSRIRRFEILLRTGSEHGRTQAPVAMLEAATKKGLGSVVDRRVVTDLIVWLARSSDIWRANPIAVTVNLSSTSLVDPHFLKFLELCLAKSGLPRGLIGFELDAALCARQAPRTREFAEVLAALGCKIVLDDFSLQDGQTELLGLKGLRMLKLHPLLTNAIATDKRRQAVVAGIAQMARVQGMHTCAKAVESSQELPSLAALKVDFAQGFAFSVPRPLAELCGAPAGRN
jgi:EAL domain-containing protein (putative c-di-GMP-specific phosphodiesterase class I)